MKVKKWVYNGFSGNNSEELAPYEAEFDEWTDDPGIMCCKCSDGKLRLIPTYALVDIDKNIPKQEYPMNEKTGMALVLFGIPSMWNDDGVKKVGVLRHGRSIFTNA